MRFAYGKIPTAISPSTRINNMKRPSIVISEIYYSIQGESTWSGFPCIFIRTTGCHLRCVYCDTPYAFYGGYRLDVDTILKVIQKYPARLVEITGGEPLLQPGVIDLMEKLLEKGYRVMLETSGDLSIEQVPPRVIKIVDIKCPDSGAFPHFYYPNLRWLMPWDELKFVVRTDRDVLWALDLCQNLGLHERWTVLFSPAHGEYSPARLSEFLLKRGLPVRLQVQLHKIIGLEECMDPDILKELSLPEPDNPSLQNLITHEGRSKKHE